MYDITRMLPPSFRLCLAGASFAEYATQRVLNDYRGPGFLANDPPPPPPHFPVSKLDRRHTGRLRKRDKICTSCLEKGVVG